MSAGWYPQPQVEWRDDRGQSLPAVASPVATDPTGLYAATSSVILKDGSGKEISCIIRNPLLSQEKTARLSIAGESLLDTLLSCGHWGRRPDCVLLTWVFAGNMRHRAGTWLLLSP